MTYSIVARDPETGEIGVAVQTCMFAVGALVPWAEAGVGAVASQAITEPAYGWRCLDAMRSGADAHAALTQARAADAAAPLRQVGVVDASGIAAAFTGELCIDHAGHHIGDGYAVQANMMASSNVWPEMAEAFEGAAGPLAARMLAALRAGEEAGGDARGRMSAAILVAGATPADAPRGGIVVDLRVDDHPNPVEELARLLDLRDAFAAYFRATDSLFAGDPAAALREVDDALALAPDDENVRFVRAGALVMSGRTGEAAEITRSLVATRPSWAVVIRGFAEKGLLPVPAGVDINAFLTA